MAGSLIGEVRRAVLPLVKAAPDVASITTRIYPGTTPANPDFPFGRVDGFRSTPLDGPCHAGAQVAFLLHGFARDRVEAGQVVETAEDVACRLGSGMKLAVHNKRVAIGEASALLRVRSVRLQPDAAESGVYHSVMECEARVLAA